MQELWKDDPELAELERLNDECDAMGDVLYDLGEELMETPATTLAGIVAKLRLGPELFPAHVEEYHERAALAFMADAARLLDVATPAGSPTVEQV